MTRARHSNARACSQAGRRLVCAVLCAVVCGGALGCQTFRGPVPASVATCRQLSQQGLTAVDQGDLVTAESLFTQAIEACPTSAEPRRQLAELLWRRGERREALAQLEAAIEHADKDAVLKVRAGEMHLALHDLKRAGDYADRALQIDPGCGPAWALRGRTMLASRLPQQALTDLHRALTFAPDDPDLLLQVAEIYRQRGQPQRALATLQRLADIYPPGEEPQHVLYLTGLAYTSLGRYEDAVESLYAASVRSPPSAQLLCSLGEAELLAGRPLNAEANVRQALSIDPHHEPSRAVLEQLTLARDPSNTVRRY